MIWDSKCLFSEVNGMLFVCLCRTVSGWAGRVGSVVRLFGFMFYWPTARLWTVDCGLYEFTFVRSFLVHNGKFC